jgi:hypothetical protein
MTFQLFDSAKASAELWSETHSAVEVSNGQFSVLLGSVDAFPEDLFDGQILYLQLEVGSDVFSPRKAIVSVAYSRRADQAGRAATAGYATEAGHSVHADTAAYSAYSPGTNPWSVSGDDAYRLTGKVGIGTASPVAELEVIGTIDADAYTINGTALGTSNDSYWSETGSDIYYMPGKVGVGTNTPSARLHVVDSKGHEGSMGSTDYAVHGIHSGGNEGYLGSGDHGAYGKYDGNDNEGVLGGLNAGVEGYAAGTVVGVCGVYGEDKSSGNKGNIGCRFEGVYGYNATSGNEGFLGGEGSDDYGVGGTAASAAGKGVYGYNSSSGNFGWLGGSGEAVYGENAAGHFGNLGGSGEGVYGQSSGGDFCRLGAPGKGAEATNSNGNLADLATTNYGVYGGHSSGTYGLLGASLVGAQGIHSNGNFGSLGEVNHAVYAYHNSGNYGYIGDTDYGVYGRNSSGNYGYLGGAVGAYGRSSNNNYGNLGDSNNGVYGRHNNGNQGFVGSTDFGIMGANSSGYFGYLGKNDQGAAGQSSAGNLGILGTSDYGVMGQHISNNVGYIGGSNRAVEGVHSGGAFGYIGSSGSGVWGEYTNGNFGTVGSNDYGLFGQSGTNSAVHGVHNGGNYGYIANANHGVYGKNANNNIGILGASDAAVKGNASVGDAGYFSGNVHVTGSVNKAACSFLIDHPLDPENKLLRHNCIESPEYLVMYRGKTRLDGSGQTTVEMPDYFVALTKEDGASIHLTPVGRPFMTGAEWNSGFRSLTVYGEANREVFWEVLAERDDPAIHQFAQPVEEDKTPEERGYYLHPKAFGLSDAKDIEWVRSPDMMHAKNAVSEMRKSEVPSVQVIKLVQKPNSPQQNEERSIDHLELQGKTAK